MANPQKRTYSTVYNALQQISDEEGIDFGLGGYTEQQFKDKYFTGPGNINNLYNKLSQISDEEGVDFGLGTRGEWLGSFGFTEEDAMPKQGYKPTAEEMEGFQSTIRNAGRSAIGSFDKKLQNLKKRQGLNAPSRVEVGKSNNLIQGEQRLNPETGELENTYITSSGNEYENEALADMEQRQIDQNLRDQRYKQTLPGQLDDAYAERDRLNAELGKLQGQWVDQDGRVHYGNRGNDEAVASLEAALRQNQQRITALEAERDDDGGTQFWRGFIDAAQNPSTLTFGMSDFGDMVQLMRIKNKMDAAVESGQQPQLSDAEQSLLESSYLNNYAQQQYGENRGFMYRAGGISMQALPFVAEFMATGGMGAISQKGAELGTRTAEKLALQGLSRSLVKNLGVLAGDVAAGWAMANTTGIFRTAGDVMQRNMGDVTINPEGQYDFGEYDEEGNYHHGGKSLGRSIYEAEVANTLEYYTEKLGEHLQIGKWLAKGADKMGLSKLSKAVNYLSGSKWLERGGIQDYPSEVVEEEANLLLNGLLVGDNNLSINQNSKDFDKSAFNPKTQLDIWGGMLFSIGLMQAPRLAYTGYSAAGYYAYKKNVDIADGNASVVFGADNWQMIKDEIDNCENDKLSDLLQTVVDGDMTDVQKTAALNYAKNLVKMRGYNMGMMAGAKDEGEATSNEGMAAQAVNQSYQQGHETQDPDLMKQFNDDILAAEQNLHQYGEEFAKEIVDASETPVEELGYLMRSRNYFTDEQIAAAADYYTKQARAKGMMEEALDRIDMAVESANAEVRANTHQQTDSVVMAKGNDNLDYYIIGGDIVTDPETGESYLAGTGGAVVVRDQLGNVSVKSPQDLTVYSMQSAEELVNTNETVLRQQLMQQADDDIMYGSPANEVYQLEDTVTLDDGEGNVIEGQIGMMPNSIDGVYVVYTPDNRALQFTADQLNRMIVAHNGMEVQRASAVLNQGENVPNQDENVLNQPQPQPEQGGETAGGEASVESGTGANEQPASALSRIPVLQDEKGQPVLKKGRPQYQWHKASVEDAAAALIETTGGDKLMARDNANRLVKTAQAKLEKIRKQEPKGEDPIELAESSMEIKRAEKEVQDTIKQWRDVAASIQKQMNDEAAARQAEIEAAKSAEQKAREAEEARQREEKQKEQDRQRLREAIERDHEKRNKEYQPLVDARNEMADDPDALAILSDTEPRSFEEWVSSLIRPHSMLWQDASDSEIGLQSELGLKRGDMQRMMSLLGNKESGAKPFGKVVLDIYEGLPEGMKNQYTDEDVRNTLLNLFNEGSSSRMMHLTEENRIEEARQTMLDNNRREAEAEMEAWAEAYHLTPEERETFEDFMSQAPSVPEQEIINQIIADEEQNNRGQEVDLDNTSGTTGRESKGGEEQVQDTSTPEEAGADQAGSQTVEGAEAGTGEQAVPDNNVPGGTPESGAIAPSEQLKPTDLRDATRVESPEIGVAEANTKARQASGETDPRTMSEEEKQRRGELLRNAPAVTVEPNQITATPELSARKAAEKWWDEHVPGPQFFDTEVGEVEINRNSVESSLAHRYSQMKLDAITSLVDGFENAVYLGTLPDGTRQEGVKNHYFAYPVIYNGQRCYVFCRALHDNNTNRLYVHEVFLEQNIKKGNTLQTAASQPHGGIALYRDILANVLDTSKKGKTLPPSETPGQSDVEAGAVTSNLPLSEDKDTNNSSNLQEKSEKSSKKKEGGLPNEPEGSTLGSPTSDVKDTNNSANLQEKTEKSSDLGATSSPEQIAEKENRVDTNPSEAQKEAGNYQKGHIKIDGYDITIENPKGSVRRGTDADGNAWETTMHNTYGYIRGTEATDGDHLDVFLSDDPASGSIFVVDQVDPKTGKFDEVKIMIGFTDAAEATEAYLSNYEKGWKGLGTITEVSREDLKKWIESSHRKTKPFADYAIVKKKGIVDDHKADGEVLEPDSQETALRDAVVDHLRSIGVEVSTDWKEGQRILDEYNGREPLSKSKKRAIETAPLNQKEGSPADISTADGAKVQQNSETANDSDEKIKEQRVYHGSGAEFDEFDHSHMGEGAGSQTFGYGTYVTNSKRIGTEYANVTSRGWLYKGMDGKELRASNDEVPEGRYYSDNEIRSFVLDYMNAGSSFEQAVDKVRRDTQSAINDHEEHLSELSPSELKDLEGFRQELKLINSFRPEDFKRDDRYLYDVEIPNENEAYYIDYYGKMGEQKDLLDMVGNALTADGWKRQEIDSRIKFTKGDKQVILTPNQSGADLYAELEDALGSDKAASEFLHKTGITGIKYPAGTIMGGGDGATNYVIFNEGDAKITDRTKFFKTPDGHAYGYTYKGKIYLDPRIATSETPIHEYSHLWAEMKRKTAPEEWNQMKQVMLTDKTVQPIIDKVRRDYPELTREGKEDDFIEEIITQFSGKRGSERLKEIADEVAAERGGIFGKAEAVTAMQRLKNILNRFWEGVAKMMGWKYRNANQIADRIMADMLNGVDPRQRMKEAANGKLRSQAEVERTLMGVHNLSEDKLRKVLKQGGLANPSLAVVDTKNHMHTDYGSISLIPKASLIDARTGRNAGTFTADAWTPTYPTVQKRMSDKGQDRFWKDLRTLREEDGEMANFVRMAFDTWLDKEVGQERLAYWYLKDKGMKPEMVRNKNPYGEDIVKRIDELTDNGNLEVSRLSEEQIKEVADMYHAYKEGIGEPVTPAEERIKRLQERMNPDKPSPFLKLQQFRLDELSKYGELLHNLNEFEYAVRRSADSDGKPNVEATVNNAQKVVKDHNLQQDFDKWLQDKADSYGIEEWLYNGTDDRTGKQKWVRNTLQNASRLMKKEGLNGAVNWSSIGNWIAKVANKEKTLAGIRKNKKNLQTTEEDHEAFREKWSQVMYDIATKLGKGDSWIGEDIMGDILDHKDYAGYLKREYGMELSKEDREAIDTFINEVQTSYPTGYFETKFERPVMLDEFEIAVVPENTSPDIVEALKNAGLDVRTYDDTGTEDQKDANRTKATMDAVQGRDDIMFQMVGKEGAAEADRAEGNDERSRNLTLAEDSEKAGVDPKAIKLATGWERGTDGQWRYEIPDADADILSKYKAKFDEMKADGVESPEPILKLGELLGEDNELFRYYPKMKDMPVLFSRGLPVGTAGAYDEGAIELNIKELNRFEGDDLNNENVYGTLLHEIQHAIQEKEGFALGGNLQTSTTEDGINAIIEKKERQRADIKTRLDANNKILNDPEELKMSAELEGKTEKEVKDQLTDTVDQQAAEYDTLGLQIERLRHTKAPSMTDARDLYHRLAGEVESRNVTERMSMTEEQRRQSLASETEDVPREDQVIINGKETENNSLYSPIGGTHEPESERPRYQKGEDAMHFAERLAEYERARRMEEEDVFIPDFTDADIAQSSYNQAVAKRSLKWREAWQDSMTSVKAIQDAIEKETGNKATGAEDAYRFENRMHGRSKNMGEQFEWSYYKPMLEAFSRFMKKTGMDIGQAMDYMIAKHGLERNMYYAFRDAMKSKIAEEIKDEREQLEKQYAKGRMSELDYNKELAILKEKEATGVDDAISEIRDSDEYKQLQQDYEDGKISYPEYIRGNEELRRNASMRKTPKKDSDGNIVSTNYYDDNAQDFSGLTGTLAKDMYDDAQKIKRAAQRTVDPDTRKKLWQSYDRQMREAYSVARGEAEKMVLDAESDRDPADKLWKAINAATKRTLQISYDSGMMDRKTYNKVRDMFDYYIPLRGWDENKASDAYTYVGKENVFSPALKKTWGRTSQAENPLAYIGNIAISTIIAGHRNMLKQHFLNYVMNNPTSLVSISESWYENIAPEGEAPVWVLRSADTAGKSTDEIVQIVNDFNEEMQQKQAEGRAIPVTGRLRLDVNATKGQKAEHVIEVQRAGHTYQLYINGDPKAAQALNGTLPKSVSRISDTYIGRQLTKLNRNMAAFFTSKNPAFVVSNLSRDLNMAGASVAVNENAEYNARFIANVAKVLAPRMGESPGWVAARKQPTGLMPSLLRKYKKGTLDPSNETERLFKEFMDEGGETGFVNMLSIDSFKEKMQGEIARMNGSSLLGSKGAKETTLGKAFRLLGDTFEFYNRCAEDATRFIVYMTSRQTGKSLEDSIADAKDVTLNFNLKGTGDKGNAEIRDLFIFVNPAIQALSNMYRMAKGHPLKFGAVTAAFIAGGALMPIINQWLLNMFGDDDDKEAYWNLPPWVRKNNLVMWVPGTKNFLTIPLAQEFRVFYGVGEMISCSVMDHPVGNMGMELVASVADLVPINPTGNGGNLLVDLSPTGVQPLVQIGENIDFTGKPIWRENQGNKYAPMYTKAYVSTPNWMVKLSEAVNDVTGGNEGKKGFVEDNLFWGSYLNNPAVWNHLLQGYFGGMYNTIAKGFDVFTTAAGGEMPKIYQTPVINRFLNRPVERDNAGVLGEEYYNLINERDQLGYELRVWKKKAADGDAEAQKRVDEIMQSDDYQRSQVISYYEKIMKDMKAGEKAATTDSDKDLIKEGISNYRQQMSEELAAINDGKDPLEAAMEKFSQAKTFQERNTLRMRIERLAGKTKSGRQKTSEDEVEKALAYITDEERESRDVNDKYLELATAEDILNDTRIKVAKGRIKEYTDEFRRLIESGAGERASEYRQKHLDWFKADDIISQQSRAMKNNQKLLGNGQDRNIMRNIANNRNQMLKAIEKLKIDN